MNAYQLVKDKGLDYLKKIIKEAPENTNFVFIGSGSPMWFNYRGNLNSWKRWSNTAQRFIKYYGNVDLLSTAMSMGTIEQAIEDFELLLEYKLPDDFWLGDAADPYGIEGTGMYLSDFAFYSNDEEKARLDRLQLALDRVEEKFQHLSMNKNSMMQACENQKL